MGCVVEIFVHPHFEHTISGFPKQSLEHHLMNTSSQQTMRKLFYIFSF